MNDENNQFIETSTSDTGVLTQESVVPPDSRGSETAGTAGKGVPVETIVTPIANVPEVIEDGKITSLERS